MRFWDVPEVAVQGAPVDLDACRVQIVLHRRHGRTQDRTRGARFSEHFGCHSLADLALGPAIHQDTEGRALEVDEAWGHDLSGCIDDPDSRTLQPSAHSRDAVAANGHVGPKSRIARAVDDPSALMRRSYC